MRKLKIDLNWKEYYDMLYCFIKKRVKNKDLAADILHDVFIKVNKNIYSLKDEKKLKNWLFQIAQNAIVDYYRNNIKADEVSDTIFDEDSNETDKAFQEVESCIIPIINKLPKNYRDVILLSEIENYSQGQVAEKVGISYVAAKARIQRGREMIKKTLLKYCTFEFDMYGKIIDYAEKGDSCKKIRKK